MKPLNKSIILIQGFLKSNKNQMFPIIDFRNGRYQGQTKNQLPHGLGCFMDQNFMFCIGEWISGELQGNTIIIFSNGSVFYGKLNYRGMQNICSFEVPEDHVQLIIDSQSQGKYKKMEKMVAIQPQFQTILDIDNNSQTIKVVQKFQYSNQDEDNNWNIVTKILHLDRAESKILQSRRNFIQYFKTTFFFIENSIFEFYASTSNGKKEYFIGLKGQGLGVKVEPNQQLNAKTTKQMPLFLIRSMGFFTKEKQLRDIGRKIINNSMKGTIYEQGIYSMSKTIIKYQTGKRPINCFRNIHAYIKRSLYYRDKVLSTQYLYDLEAFAYNFNHNLRTIETQELAKFTIQNPSNDFSVIADRQKSSLVSQNILGNRQDTFDPNPYRPIKDTRTNPELSIIAAKDGIYRSAIKKRSIEPSALLNYNEPEYIDPLYQKDQRDYYYDTRERHLSHNYRSPSQYYPSDSQYRVPEDRSYVNRPPISIPYDYAERNYPNSLYPLRNQSPNRIRRYSPSYYNPEPSDFDDRYYRYYNERA